MTAEVRGPALDPALEEIVFHLGGISVAVNPGEVHGDADGTFGLGRMLEDLRNEYAILARAAASKA